MALNRDLIIDQNRTFKYLVRWEVLPIVYKAITSIIANPTPVITATGHGLPDGWRVALTGIKGMSLNAANTPPKDRDYASASVRTPDAFELNQLNALAAGTYLSGGFVQYYTPQDLAGYSARMQVRDRVGGSVLQTLVAPTQILIDNANKLITLQLAPADTVSATWTNGVYDLELISPMGVATTLLYGAISLNPQVTL